MKNNEKRVCKKSEQRERERIAQWDRKKHGVCYREREGEGEMRNKWKVLGYVCLLLPWNSEMFIYICACMYCILTIPHAVTVKSVYF